VSSMAAIAAAGVPAVFELIKSLLPMLPTASAGVVSSTIKVLTEYAPLVIAEYKALKPIVTSAIEMLANNSATTQEQIAQLRKISKEIDADFDSAVEKSRAGDKDAGYT